jgi:hypothetical protein
VTMQDAGAGFDDEAGHRRKDGMAGGGEVNRRGEVLSAQCSKTRSRINARKRSKLSTEN